MRALRGKRAMRKCEEEAQMTNHCLESHGINLPVIDPMSAVRKNHLRKKVKNEVATFSNNRRKLSFSSITPKICEKPDDLSTNRQGIEDGRNSKKWIIQTLCAFDFEGSAMKLAEKTSEHGH
jgi:hypothetical protein